MIFFLQFLCVCGFFFYYYFCLLFIEAFPKLETSQNICTFCTTLSPLKTSSIIDGETRTLEINRHFLLAGGGIFIVLILVVIFLQLYAFKRSTNARTHTFKRNTCKGIGKSEKSEEKVQHDIELISNEIALARKFGEIRHSTNCSDTSQEYEIPRSLPRTKHAFLPLEVENTYLSPQFKDDGFEPRNKRFCENSSDLYLQPIHVI